MIVRRLHREATPAAQTQDPFLLMDCTNLQPVAEYEGAYNGPKCLDFNHATCSIDYISKDNTLHSWHSMRPQHLTTEL